jgi:hypothetical protein
MNMNMNMNKNININLTLSGQSAVAGKRGGVVLTFQFRVFLSNFILTRCSRQKLMVIYLLWKISIIWFLSEENRTREREVIE